jgi:outer membrane protein assembly factor BamB
MKHFPISMAITALIMGSLAAQGQANWPGFRGASLQAVVPEAAAAAGWDIQDGKGLLWKTDLPLPGAGSPIVWGDRVFLSGADTEGHGAVFALDAKSGKLLWRGDIALKGQPKIFDEHTTFAAPTPVTDGKRVFAVFATGAIAAFNMDGTPAWTEDLGVPEIQYGYASSPVLCKNLLIVQFDQEAEGGAALVAFDTATGKTVWRTKRDMGASWCSPAVFETEKGVQIVLASCKGVAAYDPKDGSEIWRVLQEMNDIVSTPIFTKGLVVQSQGSAGTFAIRPDGKGDVTATHVAWKKEDDGADVPSLVAYGDWIFVPSYELLCLAAADGKQAAESDMDGTFYASPIVAGGKLYLINRDGEVTIRKADQTLADLGKAAIGEPVDATPAVAAGHLFVRTYKRLLCFRPAGAPAAAVPPAATPPATPVPPAATPPATPTPAKAPATGTTPAVPGQ